VVGHCDDDYPLQKKRHTDEFLRSIAHLRARTNKYGAMARIRSRLSFAIHQFFQRRGFHYIHTPIVTGSDCEGAGEMFRVTTLDPYRAAGTVAPSRDDDFFGKEAHLTVSGQLSVETYALALSKVYTFGPTFRAENSNTSRHMAEFWMIEPEIAFADIHDDMQLAEDMVRELIAFAREDCAEDLDLFARFVDTTLIARLDQVMTSEFARLSYSDAIDILQRSGRAFEYPPEWGRDLQSEHERYLTEEHCKGPVFVYDWPREIKAFYMRCNDDGRTVAAMDLLIPQVGELIGGSAREERLEQLRGRINELGFDEKDYWWYLDTRRFGSVPHAGFGLGFERFLMFLTGVTNIRDVIPFPRTPRHLEF
jgi:asparaginyl-tRNA synthetase